jgi:hypothetical protein
MTSSAVRRISPLISAASARAADLRAALAGFEYKGMHDTAQRAVRIKLP